MTLTVYTDQHAELVERLTSAYTEESGVRFNIQNDATVGQIQAEGAASRADVFLSEDPTPVALLGREGLLAPVDQSTLDQVRPGLSSGKGLWVAYAARARVLYYNPDEIEESRAQDSGRPDEAGVRGQVRVGAVGGVRRHHPVPAVGVGRGEDDPVPGGAEGQWRQ